MKCEICHKNEATIHIQEITNIGKKKVNLCSECVLNHKLSNGITDVDINEILKKFSSDFFPPEKKFPDLQEVHFSLNEKNDSTIFQLKCSSCGWDGMKLKKTGRLGCGKCYQVFKEVLKNIIKDMHYDTVHLGKRPVFNNLEQKEIVARLSLLRKELEEHVKKEEYEQAALIRDKINDLKNLSKQDKS